MAQWETNIYLVKLDYVWLVNKTCFCYVMGFLAQMKSKSSQYNDVIDAKSLIFQFWQKQNAHGLFLMVYAHLRETNTSLLRNKYKSQGSAVLAVIHESATIGILIEFICAQNNWLE